MFQSYSIAAAIYRIFLGLIGWAALLFQFLLLWEAAEAQGLSRGFASVNFFSYFTIETNLLLTFGLSVVTMTPRSRVGAFFSRATVQTAIAGNILIVGAVYNGVLAKLWNPQGWQWLVDFVLHTLIPLLFLLYWFLFIPKGTLILTTPFRWLLYPLAYLVYSLIRGAQTGWYPYPFLDAVSLGYGVVSRNCLVLVGMFLLVYFGFTWLDRWLGKRYLA